MFSLVRIRKKKLQTASLKMPINRGLLERGMGGLYRRTGSSRFHADLLQSWMGKKTPIFNINRNLVLQVVMAIALVLLLDKGQCQDQLPALRFPNLFAGLSNPFSLGNIFRQQRQPQQQQQAPTNPQPLFSIGQQQQQQQLSPGQANPNNFLQVPPPALQQQQPQQPPPFNAFVPNTGTNGEAAGFFHVRRHDFSVEGVEVSFGRFS